MHATYYETVHARSSQIGAHRHHEPYVAFVVDGAYVECSADGAYLCEHGCLVVHPPLHLHANRFSSRRARVANLIAGSTALDEISAGAGVYQVRGLSVTAAWRAFRDGHWLDLLREAQPVSALPAPAAVASVAAALVERQDLVIARLAGRTGKTREHVSRQFRRFYGMSPSAFRAERRLRVALSLMGDASLSVSAVAHRAGYADHAHLTRSVKEATGQPPQAWRRTMQRRSNDGSH